MNMEYVDPLAKISHHVRPTCCILPVLELILRCYNSMTYQMHWPQSRVLYFKIHYIHHDPLPQMRKKLRMKICQHQPRKARVQLQNISVLQTRASPNLIYQNLKTKVGWTLMLQLRMIREGFPEHLISTSL